MTIWSILSYCAALFIAAAIPGPGMTAIVARALGSGFWPTLFMGFGLILGDLTYLTAVLLGLAWLAQSFPTPFLIIKLLGTAYLAFIAYKIWTAGIHLKKVEAEKSKAGFAGAFLSGLLVTLGNPKTMLFYVALGPTLIPLADIGLKDYAVLVLATAFTLLIVLLPYIALATRARQLLQQPTALKILNRCAASILGATALWIASRAT